MWRASRLSRSTRAAVMGWDLAVSQRPGSLARCDLWVTKPEWRSHALHMRRSDWWKSFAFHISHFQVFAPRRNLRYSMFARWLDTVLVGSFILFLSVAAQRTARGAEGLTPCFSFLPFRLPAVFLRLRWTGPGFWGSLGLTCWQFCRCS